MTEPDDTVDTPEPDDVGPPEAESEPLTCANCDAPLDPDQAYCLECGEPTPLAPPLRPRRRSAIVAAAALVLIGGAAGALGFAAGRGEDSSASTVTGAALITNAPTDAFTDTSPTVTLPADTTGGATLPSTSALPLPGVTGTGVGTTAASTDTGTATTTDTSTVTNLTDSTTSETVATDTAPTPPAGGGTDDWPSGTAGWTVQIASVRNRAAADRLARRIRGAGLPVGVLGSSNHSSFRVGGYRVVFSGQFSTLVAARRHQQKVGRTYGATIIRRISG